MKFPSINRDELTTLQVNLGYRCNQTCIHCHVNAGPNRKEMMSSKNIRLIPEVIKNYQISCLDLTGGAPELHPSFKDLVYSVKNLGVEIIDRCNLTILNEPGHEGLSEFLAENKVTIIASLPCYIEENVDSQRGKGVFERSISALKYLNTLGYGQVHSGLILNLIYNPTGPELPPDQKKLEDTYRDKLKDLYNINFTNLYTLTNMPINRFKNYLIANGAFSDYQSLLEVSYNPQNLGNVMCKNLLSVNWEGHLFDCDFNQQLNMGTLGKPSNLNDLLTYKTIWRNKSINVDAHCFGCTAGNGSSCGGSLSS